jgi:hypothetical protein
VIKIKGFSLGMEFEAAKVHCVRVFQEAGIALRPFEEMIRKVDLSVFVIAWTDPDGEAVMEISADQAGQVIRVVFHPEALEPLFGLEEASDQAIVGMLMEDRQLPELVKDPFGEARWEGEAQREDGFIVTISVKERHVALERA